MKTSFFRAALFSAALLSMTIVQAQAPRRPATQLEGRQFVKAELRVSTANVRLAELLGQLPNAGAWTEFLSRQGREISAFIDPRSGTASNILLSVPLIPGTGVGNRLNREDLARVLQRPVREVGPAEISEVLRRYVLQHREILALDTEQLGPVRASGVGGELWHVSIPQQVRGVPVRFGGVVATLNHGNLVSIGTEMWGNVRIDTKPRVTAEEARQIGFAHAGGRRDTDKLWKEPTLEIVPYAPAGQESAYRPEARPGEGYAHRLVWSFGFERPGEPGRWEATVDAHTGELVAFVDTSYSQKRKIKGGVYPMTNTGFCPSSDRCGVSQPGTPMPWANYTLSGETSNGAGVFELAGTATTTLQGKFIRVTDRCGSISESAGSGDIDLGSGGHNCGVSFGHSPGDTSSARSVTYELNRIAEIGRGWLPNNNWVRGLDANGQPKPLDAITNSGGLTCNAAWDGVQVLFGKGGEICDSQCCNDPNFCCITNDCPGTTCVGSCPLCCHQCRNPGEIAGIIDHEWGHGLDANDGSMPNAMTSPAEAYADIAAMYKLQVSCGGYGFTTAFPGNNEGCGLTSDGTGFNRNMAQVGPGHCNVECSGSRQMDWRKHAPAGPDTPQSFTCQSCGGGLQVGPCGKEIHCEAAPTDQAAWDFAAFDLQAAPYNYDATTAFNVANRLFYLGSAGVQSWHTCDCTAGTSDGCGAASGYMKWLFMDDDNGDPFDGTPHMVALSNAFAGHNIGCASPTAQDSGCAGGPTAAPPLFVTPGSYQVRLSWLSVSGASSYRVFRAEGQAECASGRALIGQPTGLSFIDTEVAAGRRYFYTIAAVGTSEACSGPSSECRCATPFDSGPLPDVLAASDFHTGPGTILSGSYLDTRVSDDSYEVLRETLSGGKSKLTHIWKFTGVPGGCLVLNFEGIRPNNSEGDDFRFAWAPDVNGAPGTFQDIPDAVIQRVLEPVGGFTAPFGNPGLSGTIYIRIEDTNRGSGKSLDTVSIDRLAILPR